MEARMTKSLGYAGIGNEFKVRQLVAIVLGAALSASTTFAHAEKNPLRDVFFGETHIHTSWSFGGTIKKCVNEKGGVAFRLET
jgi:hypothetical protein